jgi:hypothetical protein
MILKLGRTRSLLAVLLLVLLLQAYASDLEVKAADSSGSDSKTLVLIQPEEASDLRLSDQDYSEILRQAKQRRGAEGYEEEKGAPGGPDIHFEAPEPVSSEDSATSLELRVTPPASLHVSFLRNASDVDMDSLRVRARRGIFSRDLTDRLAPYIIGTSIRAEQIDVPTGRFRIELRIEDVEGRRTEAEYLMVSRNAE